MGVTGRKGCMRGSITDMTFSSVKIILSTEFPQWGKTHFLLLSMGTIKRVSDQFTCDDSHSHI